MAEKRQVWMGRGAMARWVVAVAVVRRRRRGAGSGRSRADAEARRHRRLRAGRRIRLPQPVERLWWLWSSVLLDAAKGSPAGLRPRSRLHESTDARLEGDVHQDAAVHPDVRDPSRGSLERRRPRHRPGLPLHAPGDPQVPPRRRPSHARTQRPRRRFEDGPGRPAVALRGMASPVLVRRCRSTRSPARISRGSGRMASRTRRQAGRSAPGPSSSETGSVESSSRSSATRTTGARTRRISTG